MKKLADYTNTQIRIMENINMGVWNRVDLTNEFTIDKMNEYIRAKHQWFENRHEFGACVQGTCDCMDKRYPEDFNFNE